MQPHLILVVNVDQDEIAWGVVTLAYLYWQLGMASRAGCKTIAGCLILLQTWIYEYFPAFRPHPHREDVPIKTRAKMWTTKKPFREVDRLRDCRSVLDSMTETQVEWTPYVSAPRALLNEHPPTTFIGGITCFDIVEVYLLEQTVRQVGFVQAIPPSYETSEGCATGTRFPFSARIGEHALRRASVPSETESSYVDWFRVYSHPFLALDEGPIAGPGPSQSRAEYSIRSIGETTSSRANEPPGMTCLRIIP
ncbi:protein MAINTENANCE OF MERISTEMS-like [Amaranthus tricolor]|uniref:protein MAINTENANCE OF MERISTEMS-like n=1 Tax=Amaranthus tricolor TaxID=29722 RepID=UPI002589B7A0|nr:protein MAINTENANCE OF MERISTEMS-like [Amaranthus tricolor]